MASAGRRFPSEACWRYHRVRRRTANECRRSCSRNDRPPCQRGIPAATRTAWKALRRAEERVRLAGWRREEGLARCPLSELVRDRVSTVRESSRDVGGHGHESGLAELGVANAEHAVSRSTSARVRRRPSPARNPVRYSRTSSVRRTSSRRGELRGRSRVSQASRNRRPSSSERTRGTPVRCWMPKNRAAGTNVRGSSSARKRHTSLISASRCARVVSRFGPAPSHESVHDGAGDHCVGRREGLAEETVEYAQDSGRYKVANCTQAQPVFYGFAGLPDGKVILVSVLSVSASAR